MLGWNKTDVLNEYVGKVVDIERPTEDLKGVLISNILLDPKTYEIKEISYIEDKGTGRKCHFKPEVGIVIKPIF